MANPVDLREVKVTSTLLGDTLEPSRVTCIASCGEPARVEMDINVVSSDKMAAKTDDELSEILDINKQYQLDAFSDNAARASVSIIDNILGDSSNSLTFDGFISAPGFQVSSGSFGAQISIIQEDIQMENFNPSVYAADPASYGQSHADTVAADFFNSLMGTGRAKSVSEHLLMLLSASHGNPKMTFNIPVAIEAFDGAGPTGNRKKQMLAIHQANGNSIDYIKGFLGRSINTLLQVDSDPNNTVEDLALLSADAGTDIGNFDTYRHWLHNAYVGSKNYLNFILSTVCPSFLFEYVCNMDGYSYMQHPKTNHKEFTEASIQPLSIKFNLASRYQKAIGQVASFGTGTGKHGDGPGSPLHMGAYPNPPAPETGKFISTSMPGWFNHTTYKKPFDYIANTGGHRDPVGVAEADVQMVKEAKDVKPLQDNKGNFYEVWAQKQYYLWALKNTSAAFTVPLDVSWAGRSKPLGERYSILIQNPDGENLSMIRGYLNRVVHNIQTNAANSNGTAQTQLEFTHIKTPDFELPG